MFYLLRNIILYFIMALARIQIFIIMSIFLPPSFAEVADIECGPGYIIERSQDNSGFICSPCPEGTFNMKTNNDRCEFCTYVYEDDPYVKVVAPCKPDRDTLLECRDPEKMYLDGKTCRFIIVDKSNTDPDAESVNTTALPGNVYPGTEDNSESITTSQEVEKIPDNGEHVTNKPEDSPPDKESKEKSAQSREWGVGPAVLVFMMAAVVSALVGALVHENNRKKES